VQNSFGPSWNAGTGDSFNARIWFGYAQLFESQGLGLIEFPNSDAAPSGVRLTASRAGPELFVRESKTYQEGGNPYSMLILHGTNAVNLKAIPSSRQRASHLNQTSPIVAVASITFGPRQVKRPRNLTVRS
jgi:hypothetical protein